MYISKTPYNSLIRSYDSLMNTKKKVVTVTLRNGVSMQLLNVRIGNGHRVLH